MIFFYNKIKIKWEWGNLKKFKVKLPTNQMLKDELKRNKKPDSSQYTKLADRL
jgi:hypothetical protein